MDNNILIEEQKEMVQVALTIIANGYKVMDDHIKKVLPYKPIGLALKITGEIGLLLKCKGNYCLNKVYMQDDVVHNSILTIGGRIDGIKKLNIKEYNSKCKSNDYIIKTLYLEDLHIGAFNDIDDFDKFFYNDDSVLVL